MDDPELEINMDDSDHEPEYETNLDRFGLIDFSMFASSDAQITESQITESQIIESIDSPKKLTDDTNFNKYVPIDFGLPNKDLNWRMGAFIDMDRINKIPFNEYQIDVLADILDWDIISTMELSGPMMVKHKDNINWEVFLRNGKPKEINYLIDVKDKLIEHNNLFFNPRMKRKYYNTPFVLVFPTMIDFKWLVKHVKLEEYVLLKFWNKFKPNDIAKYQNITYAVAKEKLNQINWLIASRKPLTEDTIALAHDFVNWQVICRRQKHLSEDFLIKFIKKLHWANVSKYQTLTDKFIRTYRKKLDLCMVSEYQNMSIDTIRELELSLDFDKMAKNKNYNKPGKIQIVSNGTSYFVIEPPMMGTIPKVSYYATSEAEL